METGHTETVVEKAVAYVKDVLGIHPTDAPPDVEANPEYSDTAPEVTAEDAMRLDPNAYTMKSIGELNSETSVPPESGGEFTRAKSTEETDAERLRREADKPPRQKSALELNSESARLEDGE
jgi:hypothetical protein